MRILLKLKAKLLSGKYNYRAKDHKSTTGHFYTAKLLSNLSTSTGLTFTDRPLQDTLAEDVFNHTTTTFSTAAKNVKEHYIDGKVSEVYLTWIGESRDHHTCWLSRSNTSKCPYRE